MDEFTRMMKMEGVRPLDQAKRDAAAPVKKSVLVLSRGTVAMPEPVGYAWVAGPRARTALETAPDALR